jgi:hypothetical protein
MTEAVEFGPVDLDKEPIILYPCDDSVNLLTFLEICYPKGRRRGFGKVPGSESHFDFLSLDIHTADGFKLGGDEKKVRTNLSIRPFTS